MAALAALAAGVPDGDDAARRRGAIGNWSAMARAMILARLSDDPALSAEVLHEPRAWIGEGVRRPVREPGAKSGGGGAGGAEQAADRIIHWYGRGISEAEAPPAGSPPWAYMARD
jgi:hypothetical protein